MTWATIQIHFSSIALYDNYWFVILLGILGETTEMKSLN